MAVDNLMTDQLRGGTYRENVIKLQKEFRELISDGDPDPKKFEMLLFQLMKNFETERLKNEAQIRRLKEEMAFCEATNRACVLFSNVLISTVAAVRHDLKPIEVVPVSEKAVPITDTEMLKKICICGCVDEEDAKTCKCVCHTKGYCDVPTCDHCKKVKEEKKKSVISLPKEEFKEKKKRGRPPAVSGSISKKIRKVGKKRPLGN